MFTLLPLKILTDQGDQRVYEIKQSGRYDITIYSYSKQKILTLCVDHASAEVAHKRYKVFLMDNHMVMLLVIFQFAFVWCSH